MSKFSRLGPYSTNTTTVYNNHPMRRLGENNNVYTIVRRRRLLKMLLYKMENCKHKYMNAYLNTDKPIVADL